MKYVFLLFGPPHSGKSTTGNILLGRKIFMENDPTKKCAAAEATLEGNIPIRVIDTKATPDYLSDTYGILEANSEITRSLLLSPFGPRNVMLVVKKGQRPTEVAGCLQFMKILLGRDALELSTLLHVLFSYLEDLFLVVRNKEIGSFWGPSPIRICIHNPSLASFLPINFHLCLYPHLHLPNTPPTPPHTYSTFPFPSNSHSYTKHSTQ